MKMTSTKYRNISDEHYPINGNMVHYHIRKNNLSKSQLAKDLGVLPTTVTTYFKQPSLQFGILWKISKALNHNFLAQMSEYLQIPFETQAEKKLKTVLTEKEDRIRELEIELKVYKEMMKR